MSVWPAACRNKKRWKGAAGNLCSSLLMKKRQGQALPAEAANFRIAEKNPAGVVAAQARDQMEQGGFA